MKKVFLLLTAISLSLFAQAKIGYLLLDVEKNDDCIQCNAPFEGVDPGNIEVSPERASVIWFHQHYVDPSRSTENNYGEGQIIMNRDFLDTDLSEIDVLWIPIGRKVENIDQLNGFLNDEQKTKLIGFIKDGGNVFLSGFATYYVRCLGRMTDDLKYITYSNGYGNHDGTWSVRLADAEPTHAVWKHLGTPDDTQEGWKKYPLVSGQRNDRNCLWADKNWTNFQNAHNCKILGFWGNNGEPNGAGFIEFYPKDDWKGTIIVNGLAAYQWKIDNYDEDSYKENIKKLTRGVLDYLSTSISAGWGALEESSMRIGGGFELRNSVKLSSELPEGCTLKFYSNDPVTANTDEAGGVYCNYFGNVTFRAEIKGDGIHAPKNIMWQANSPELTVNGSSLAKFGYILPYSLHTMSEYNNTQGNNEDGNRPDFVSADWFNVNYIIPNDIPDKGCFLNPKYYSAANPIPQEVEVLWIHNDHVGLSSANYFEALGSENFVAALRQFVDRGGKVFLSKQGTRLVGDLHMLGMHDAHNYVYPSFKHEDHSGYITPTPNNDPWSIKNTYTYGDETIDYSSHAVYNGLDGYPVLQEKPRRTNNEYLIEQINDLKNYDDYIAAEQQYQCRLLGCYGNGQDNYAGAIFVEFLPRTAGQGTVIMMGAPAYHWTGKEIGDINENLTKLTKNILEYLATIKTDVYTRDVTNGNYGTICLPRASKTIEGATMWRVLEQVTEGVVIEQVSAMEAGVPYFFQATANQLKVEMQGATEDAKSANGLVGHINEEGLKHLVPQNPNHYVLSQNQLYYVNSVVDLPTNYAYVNVNDIASLAAVAGMPRRTMRLPQDENGTTALENIQTSATPSKIIQNGQVYILRDGHIYTTLGTQVK